MKKTFLMGLLALGLCATANAGVITLNAADFFEEQIENGKFLQDTSNLWQLGYLSGGVFTLFNYNENIRTPNEPQNNFTSFDFYKNSVYYGFGINRTDNDVSVFDGTVRKGEIYAHPGDTQNGNVILRFLAPEDAVYELSSLFSNLHYGLVGLDISLNNSNGQSTLFSDSIQRETATYASSINLNKADFIDFSINRHNGTWAGDSLSIGASMSYPLQAAAVSEPATAFLLMLGMGAIVARRKSKPFCKN